VPLPCGSLSINALPARRLPVAPAIRAKNSRLAGASREWHQYGTLIEQASGVVLIGTLLSVVTLTAVMWLEQMKLQSRLPAQIGICLSCGS
jgi:hypothetical protein